MDNTKSSKKLKTTDLVYIALSAVIIAVLSWISIPATVPFTLQTFAVFAVIGIIGGKRGTFAVIVYILLGAVGVPVFAGFSGGIGVILGSTGGYIIGFIFIGLICWMTEILVSKSLQARIVSMVLGLIVCYAFGTAWFMTVYARQTGAIGLGTALSWCVIPFIIPDLIKMALAILISERIKKAIKL